MFCSLFNVYSLMMLVLQLISKLRSKLQFIWMQHFKVNFNCKHKTDSILDVSIFYLWFHFHHLHLEQFPFLLTHHQYPEKPWPQLILRLEVIQGFIRFISTLSFSCYSCSASLSTYYYDGVIVIKMNLQMNMQKYWLLKMNAKQMVETNFCCN